MTIAPTRPTSTAHRTAVLDDAHVGDIRSALDTLK